MDEGKQMSIVMSANFVVRKELKYAKMKTVVCVD